MEVKIITDVDPADEPVTITEAKAYCRIDADYYENDPILESLIVSARERLEKFTNLSFAPKRLQVQFSGDRLDIPYGPVNAIVSLTDNETPPVSIDTDKYHVTGLDFKKLYLNSINNASFFYGIDGTVRLWGYTERHCISNLVYDAGYGSEYGTPLPKTLKDAILVQINEDYKNLGNPMLEDLSPIAKQMANRYSRNLVIQ